MVYIEGKIRSRSYDDQNGIKRYVTEIVADSIELLNRKSSDTDRSSSDEPQAQSRAPISKAPEVDDNTEVDDLPF